MKTKRKTNINRATEELKGYLAEIAAAKHRLLELDQEWQTLLTRYKPKQKTNRRRSQR